MRKKVIITGGAGFIGSNLTDYFLKRNWAVTCIDNFDNYYSSEIKKKNIACALKNNNYKLIQADIKDLKTITDNISENYSAIVHLAAKAGVRYSLEYPVGYEESNVQGTKRTIELAKHLGIKQFIFASSSSIYGNAPTPFCEQNNHLKPVSPYAQTKLLSEEIGKYYADKFNLNFISLRFFSVYGPRLRPDLVMNKIAESIYKEKTINIFGDGSAARDYTYVDDIIQGIVKAIDYDSKGFDIFNLGKGQPIKLSEIIKLFENISGKEVKTCRQESIDGESDITWANNTKAIQKLGFNPHTDIKEGIKKYLDWYLES